MATPTTEPVRLPPGPRAPKIVQGVTFLTARQPVRSPRSTRARENTALHTAHLCSRDDHPVLSVRATAESMG